MGSETAESKTKKKDHTDNYQKQNTNITKVNFTYFNYSSENSIYTKIFTSSSIVCTSSSENDEGCCVAFRCWTLATVSPSRTSSRRRRRRRVCGGSSCRREPWQAPCPAQGPPPWTGWRCSCRCVNMCGFVMSWDHKFSLNQYVFEIYVFSKDFGGESDSPTYTRMDVYTFIFISV